VIDVERLERGIEEALSTDIRRHRGTLPPEAAWGEWAGTGPDPIPPGGTAPLPPGGRHPRRRGTWPTPPPDSPPHQPAPPVGIPPSAPVAPGSPDPALDALVLAVAAALEAGDLTAADHHIAEHARAVAVRGGRFDEAEAASLAAMRALLDGDGPRARAGADRLAALAREAGDDELEERWWRQRYWIALHWGDDDERYAVLDHCRDRAYRGGDLVWRSMLALFCAHMGRAGEAAREFDAAAGCLGGPPPAGPALDVATNLAEVAALLGDGPRATAALQALRPLDSGLTVVAGRAEVCKGSLARYRALAASATGRHVEGDRAFEVAVEAHRAQGLRLLLARTLVEWAQATRGRDELRAKALADEGTGLACSLGVDLAPVAPAPPPSASPWPRPARPGWTVG